MTNTQQVLAALRANSEDRYALPPVAPVCADDDGGIDYAL